MVSMVAFQAVDPGSIPGHRRFNFSLDSLRDSSQAIVNLRYHAWLAQSVEHETLNLRVVGSSPTLGDQFNF